MKYSIDFQSINTFKCDTKWKFLNKTISNPAPCTWKVIFFTPSMARAANVKHLQSRVVFRHNLGLSITATKWFIWLLKTQKYWKLHHFLRTPLMTALLEQLKKKPRDPEPTVLFPDLCLFKYDDTSVSLFILSKSLLSNRS